MRVLPGELSDFVIRCLPLGGQLLALAVDSAEDRIGQFARADAMPDLRQLHRLRDRRVRRHAVHVQQLVDAEAQEVSEVGMQASDSAAHTRMQRRIEILAPAKQSVYEFLRPSPVARVEIGRTSIEGRIEQQSVAQRSEEHTSELQSQSNLVCR